MTIEERQAVIEVATEHLDSIEIYVGMIRQHLDPIDRYLTQAREELRVLQSMGTSSEAIPHHVKDK
jgi:hypothetical protein